MAAVQSAAAPRTVKGPSGTVVVVVVTGGSSATVPVDTPTRERCAKR
jgi:hypothetical protein